MLKKQHRVVVTDGGFEQALGIGGGAARHDPDAGHGVEIGLQPLAVLCPQLPSHAPWSPHHHGNGVVAAAGVAQHAHVVGNLVEGQEQKAHVHALHDGPQARHGCTHRHAGEAVLRDGGIQKPQIPVLLVQIFGDLIGAAVVTHVFPDDQHTGIPLHLLVDGFAESIEKKGFCHRPGDARPQQALKQNP